MVMTGEKKLFLGGRLRRLRSQLGLTQSRMAEDLSISPSYLNLLERNQRPVTAQVLLQLAEAYDLDLRSLSGDEDAGAVGLTEVFADPLFKGMDLSRHEVAEVASNAPALTEAVIRLYQAFSDRRRTAEMGDGAVLAQGGAVAPSPTDWVRGYTQGQRNYFPELEELAETISGELAAAGAEIGTALTARLADQHRIRVLTAPRELLSDAIRRYDLHRRRLFLSELMAAPSRLFALAHQIGAQEGGQAIEAIIDRAAPPDRATRSLTKVSLANYLAAAILMPYAAFHAAMERNAYDVELVRPRFGVSFEQACHRLITLSRPGARGIPFFMLRVDPAGNVSKRYANGSFPLSRFGGACPRWNIHSTFRSPSRILTQIVETPDGERYFTVARTVHHVASAYAGEDSDLAIGLGCELKYAPKLAYSRGVDMAKPLVARIGPACRLCEREACPQRSVEPLTRTLLVDDFVKTITAYPFAPG